MYLLFCAAAQQKAARASSYHYRGVVAGSVIGGLAALAVIITLIVALSKRKNGAGEPLSALQSCYTGYAKGLLSRALVSQSLVLYLLSLTSLACQAQPFPAGPYQSLQVSPRYAGSDAQNRHC